MPLSTGGYYSWQRVLPWLLWVLHIIILYTFQIQPAWTCLVLHPTPEARLLFFKDKSYACFGNGFLTHKNDWSDDGNTECIKVATEPYITYISPLAVGLVAIHRFQSTLQHHKIMKYQLYKSIDKLDLFCQMENIPNSFNGEQDFLYRWLWCSLTLGLVEEGTPLANISFFLFFMVNGLYLHSS